MFRFLVDKREPVEQTGFVSISLENIPGGPDGASFLRVREHNGKIEYIVGHKPRTH